uniref:(northern house mosquito) hypothetical protein n=1 Tax=Culex pipiens TaxID=7175 RepID=A0A8D8IQK2_CULPI
MRQLGVRLPPRLLPLHRLAQLLVQQVGILAALGDQLGQRVLVPVVQPDQLLGLFARLGFDLERGRVQRERELELGGVAVLEEGRTVCHRGHLISLICFEGGFTGGKVLRVDSPGNFRGRAGCAGAMENSFFVCCICISVAPPSQTHSPRHTLLSSRRNFSSGGHF